MRFTAIFTPNTLYSNNVLKSNEKTKIRQLFVTAKFFCCESEKNFPPHPCPAPASTTHQRRTNSGRCTIFVQYLYNICTIVNVQILYKYCTYIVHMTELVP